MGSLCGSGSSDTTRVQPIQTRTTTELPEYVKKGGEEIFGQAKPLSTRDYPVYGQPRIAEFDPSTQQSFDTATSGVGAWKPYFDQAVGMANQGVGPVGQADIDKYMNPYTKDALNPAIDVINRQAQMDKLARHGSWAQRGSYLNEDRRDVIDIAANEARDRTVAGLTGNMNLQAFNAAVAQANQERQRQLGGAGVFTQLGQIPGQQAAQDAATQASVGAQKEAKTQQNLSLGYQDFLSQYYFPQEQLTWLNSVLSGIPYETMTQSSGQQIVPQPNTFAQNLGAFGALAGGAGMFGRGFGLGA